MQALKIVLIGYGKMGHVIEEIARARGHEIVLTIDRDEEHLFDDPRFAAADVAIEFTAPAMAYDNCRRAIDRGVPVVSGTTGWADKLPSCVSAVRRVRGRSFGPPTTASASSSSYRSIAV